MKKERKEKKSRPIIPKKGGAETEVINDASRRFLNIFLPFSDPITADLVLHIPSDLTYVFLTTLQYTVLII